MEKPTSTYPVEFAPKAMAKQPVPPGQQFPEPAIPGACTGFFHLWFEGVRVLGRFLAFWITLTVIMIPLWPLNRWINPKDLALFGEGGVHFPAAVQLAILVVYLPFAGLFAARFSRQLLKSC